MEPEDQQRSRRGGGRPRQRSSRLNHSSLKNVSVGALQKALDDQRSRLRQLKEERVRLATQLAALDSEIARLEGRSTAASPGERPARKSNPRPLIRYILEALAQHPQGLNLRDLETQILAAGYQTTSRHFQQTLYQSIYMHHDKVLHDPASRVYKLAVLPR